MNDDLEEVFDWMEAKASEVEPRNADLAARLRENATDMRAYFAERGVIEAQ
jgi:hypothetical protein